jgi:hypothetical protein
MGSLGTQNKHQGGLYHSLFNLLNFRKPTKNTRAVSYLFAQQAQDRIV